VRLLPPLTPRDAAALDVLEALTDDGSNNGPSAMPLPKVTTTSEQLSRSAARAPNGMQRGLSAAAMLLPTAAADVAAHLTAFVGGL
jgi:hypothetical protein